MAQTICTLCCLPFPIPDREWSSDYSSYFTSLKSLIGFEDDDDDQEEVSFLACLSCMTNVTCALDAKKKVIKVEETLRGIQLQILKLKRKVVSLFGDLKGAVGDFKEVMGDLEETLEESKEKVDRIDEFLGREESGKGELVKGILFREKVLSVMSELTSFGSELEIKCVKTGNESGRSEIDRAKSSEVEIVDQDDNSSPVEIISLEDSLDDDKTDGEDDYVPPKKLKLTKGKLSKKKKISQVKSPSISSGSIDLSGMTPFKQSVINKVIRRSARKGTTTGTKEDSSIFDEIDPLNLNPPTYDPTTDTLSLGGIQLIINEQDESISCSQCGVHLKGDLTKVVYTHVLSSSHLDLLQCPYCGSKLSEYFRFKEHVLSHGNKFQCDICGKPLKTKKCLRNHKWHHMNQEEKQAAVEAGAKPPPNSWLKAKKKGTRFQCDICGKQGFLSLAYLKKHEVTHQEPGFICPKCAKPFREKSQLVSHLKYVCQEPEEREKALRFQCNICSKKFPYENKLRLHKKTVHSELRPFDCGVCGKGFKTERNLKIHQATHLDTRPFECGRGCGAKYKTRTHVSRHEKNCSLRFQC